MPDKDEELVDDNTEEKIEQIPDVNQLDDIESDDDKDAIDLSPYIYPIASFLIPLIVYWRTMCTALYIGDGGDFITASHTLGLPHPPGYPLYTLLGKLFLSLPIPGGLSEAAWRMNFMSAFFGALTALLAYLLIKRITKYDWLAFFAALTIAFGRTFWSQAVIAEVYTLNTFFILLQLYLLVIRTDKFAGRTLIWMGLALGLSLAHHPSIAIFFPAYIYYSYIHRDYPMTRLLIVALAFGLAIINPIGILAILLLIPHELIIAKVKKQDFLKLQKSALAFALLVFILSVGLYAYLPIVKYKNPVTGPLEFESIQQNVQYFVETVTRSIYQYKAMSPGEALTTTPMVFKRYLEILWDDYLALVFIFFLGFMAIKRKVHIAAVAFICYALFMITVLFYPSGDILHAPLKNLEVVMPPLMIPAQLMYILFGFIGIGCVLDWIPGYVESMRKIDPMPTEKKIRFLNGVVIGSLVLLVLVVIPIHNWFFCDKSKSLTAYNYARNVIISAPDNSFVLNTGDETFLFWYLTEVEHFMPEKNVVLQNWIHNIRGFEVLANEEQAIKDVLMWVLKNREWSITDKEFKEIDHHLPKFDHYCATFLTDYIQKDILFASQDVVMHDLVYEFVFKPQEYYDKYNYEIHPEYGIVKIEEPIDLESEDAEKTPFISLEKRRMEQSYFEDDYPGMRLRMDGDIPFDTFHWEGLFIPEYDATGKVIKLDYDQSYHDPQEDEIIGRYQEMLHNIGAWNVHVASGIERQEDQVEPLKTATSAFRNEIKLKVTDPVGWLSLGNVYIQLRMMDQAVEALTQHKNLVMFLPDSTMKKKSEAHYYLAYALYIMGDFNHARKEIDSALLFDSTSEQASKLRKTILEQEELTRKKIDKLKKKIENSDEEDEEIEDGMGSLELGGELEKSDEGEGKG
ncbi:DUF2723 domain-containing protein [bacterium]|nr:DUF2723 domain-containing protein [bacterium]